GFWLAVAPAEGRIVTGSARENICSRQARVKKQFLAQSHLVRRVRIVRRKRNGCRAPVQLLQIGQGDRRLLWRGALIGRPDEGCALAFGNPKEGCECQSCSQNRFGKQALLQPWIFAKRNGRVPASNSMV